jgi:hypothetical protein
MLDEDSIECYVVGPESVLEDSGVEKDIQDTCSTHEGSESAYGSDPESAAAIEQYPVTTYPVPLWDTNTSDQESGCVPGTKPGNPSFVKMRRCPFVYRTHSEFVIKTEEADNVPYSCSICNKIFWFSSAFWDHVVALHDIDPESYIEMHPDFRYEMN